MQNWEYSRKEIRRQTTDDRPPNTPVLGNTRWSVVHGLSSYFSLKSLFAPA